MTSNQSPDDRSQPFASKPSDEFLHAVKTAAYGPRGIALAMAALLDSTIRDMIITTHGSKDSELKVDSVFAERGLLGGFTSKIQFLYLTGIISDGAYADLVIISRVRNRFAHEAEVHTFENSRVKGQLEKLKMIDHPLRVQGHPEVKTYKDILSIDRDEMKFDYSRLQDRYIASTYLFATIFSMTSMIKDAKKEISPLV